MSAHPHTQKLDRLDLNLLRVFIAVYDGGGVTAAAKVLHLSQPTLSNALARLRRALDDALFVREGIALKPTPFAQRLAPAVRAALAGIGDALSNEPVFEPASARRRFKVAMTDAGQMVFLPRLARALREQAPGVLVDAMPLDPGDAAQAPGQLTGALSEGLIDCAIGPLAAGPFQDLIVEGLFTERYVGLLANPAGSTPGQAKRADTRRPSPAAAARPGLSDLRKMPLVLVEHNTTHHRVIGETLERLKLSGNVVCRVPYFSSVAPMIGVHEAMAILPSEIANILESEGRGRVIPLPFALARYTVSLVRHPRFARDAGQNWFAALIRATLGK